MEKTIVRVEFKLDDMVQLGKTQRFITIDLDSLFKSKEYKEVFCEGLLEKGWNLSRELERLKNQVQATLEKKGLDVIALFFEVSCTGIIREETKNDDEAH